MSEAISSATTADEPAARPSASARGTLFAELSGRWQFPLLFVGICLLAGGLIRMARGAQGITHDERVARVRRLHEAGALARAVAYLTDLLNDPERPSAERGELHRLLAKTVYLAERGLKQHDARRVAAIVENLNAARRLGAPLAGEDWVAFAEAHCWGKRFAEAVEAYRQALRVGVPRADRVTQQLLFLLLRNGDEPSAEVLAGLDRLLAAPSAAQGKAAGERGVQLGAVAGDVFIWALDVKVQWLLRRGDIDAALALVGRARRRLAGTEQRLAVDYFEALCMKESGRLEQAEMLLRGLRNGWTSRDDLWARAGWLLGRIQQEDDRPEAAIAFYDEVMRAVPSGPVHDACRLGVAECLAGLERFEAALAEFRALASRPLDGGGHPLLEARAIRATVAAAGESLLQSAAQPPAVDADGDVDAATWLERRTELGLSYLELALSLTPEADRDVAAGYLLRLGQGYADLAGVLRGRVSEGTTPDGETMRTVEQLHVRAAQRYLRLAAIRAANDEAATRALERAADNFDAAGRRDEAIEVLTRHVRDYPGSLGRSTALYRLGQAHQARGEFRQAIAAYEEVIRTYPRLPDALASFIPLAECLMQAEPPSQPSLLRQRGVNILLDIVDDRGDEQLFAPQAAEYRQGLFKLCEYYARAEDEEVPGRVEKAITRLEDALLLYPDDLKAPHLRFLLADCYRRSGLALRDEAARDGSAAAADGATGESRRRLRVALENYERVIAALAPADRGALSPVEAVDLQSSYLCRADCLFDLGEHEAALEAYREAEWRYEDRPAAIAAAMQAAHCLQRLGRGTAAAAAVARLKWLLHKIPASAFEDEPGTPPKDYWVAMVDRWEKMGIH